MTSAVVMQGVAAMGAYHRSGMREGPSEEELVSLGHQAASVLLRELVLWLEFRDDGGRGLEHSPQLPLEDLALLHQDRIVQGVAKARVEVVR